ncbi:hypothetical protein H7698_13970 [Pseudomonas sp. p50]|uniref:hypothetical protein n=1 Tax=Pseudomonas sp. p50(2008) TaxID=2816832 RepID=UPI00188ABA3A|nr:hypothetical protein [Pseudomonas sp. p50(2008)]MBF4557187.1 hypothetical protein [Pseudomonas sp. p50(2008)]
MKAVARDNSKAMASQLSLNDTLTKCYDVMMYASKNGVFNSTAVRGIYTHIIGPGLKRRICMFTGKVSRAALANLEGELVLEHFHRLQHELTKLVARHMMKGENCQEFIDAIYLMEKVHIVTKRENYDAMKAKGCYTTANIELLDWSELSPEAKGFLRKRMLSSRVANIAEFI